MDTLHCARTSHHHLYSLYKHNEGQRFQRERLKRTQHAGMMRPKVERGEAQIATSTSVYCFSKAKHRIQFHLEFLSVYF